MGPLNRRLFAGAGRHGLSSRVSTCPRCSSAVQTVTYGECYHGTLSMDEGLENLGAPRFPNRMVVEPHCLGGAG